MRQGKEWMDTEWKQIECKTEWPALKTYHESKWFSDIKCWMKIELQNKLFKGECGWDEGEHRGILDEVDKKDWGEKPYMDTIKNMIKTNMLVRIKKHGKR